MSSSKPTTLRGALPGLRRTVKHVAPHMRSERPLLVGGLAAMFAEVLMRLLEPWPLKFVLDGVIAASGAEIAGEAPASLPTVLLLACVGLLVVVSLRAFASYLMTIAFALAGNRLLTKIRGHAFTHLQTLSMAFHDNSRTGDLVARVTSDVGRLKEVAVTAALPLIGNVVTMIAMVGVVFILDAPLALVMIAVLPIFFLTGARVSKRINGVSRQQRKAEGELASMATESLSAMRVIQSYSLEDKMSGAFASNNQKTLKDGVKAKKLSAGLERKTDVLVGLATAAVLYIGANRVLAGALTPGELVVFITYLKAAFKPMRDLAKYTGRIAQAAASGERLVDVLEETPKVVNTSWARHARRFRGDVWLRGVWMSYTPGHPVLRGLDLHVRPGERVAVVGPSGAGKSSIAMLLSRLRDPEAGQVCIDGIDVRDLTLESLRPQIAIVLQESLLFATTIRENIADGAPGTTDAQVEAAARLAGAHDFITAMPNGYDTVVGERGTTLSGGQRQRIAIARAAVRDAPIVILDEAMTGLDKGTEDEVIAAMNRLTEGRTTIIITHDMAAARDADRVFWVDGGVVTDSGRPDAVLGRHVDPAGTGGALVAASPGPPEHTEPSPHAGPTRPDAPTGRKEQPLALTN
ncbi:ABC transporter ATP-binding protein [Occultella gossypii]|uniref:ABC transporter ATP-binding protein n=1 Tax=Occultella gossypii TaxID=2800820 RepID=A0ABS7S8X5_9MICO|nr:ABC transporter ATP-binding protein [Occultella gossypii]MBZ2196804.1 ABC transporter ATP-binding protein [Occultella gossypii]